MPKVKSWKVRKHYLFHDAWKTQERIKLQENENIKNWVCLCGADVPDKMDCPFCGMNENNLGD